MSGIVVAGTDTGVGKTWVAAAILHAVKSTHRSPAYWKPVQTGQDDDTSTVKGLTNGNVFPAGYHFRDAVSPYLAAQREGKIISAEYLDKTKKEHEKACDFLVVEGSGGWLVPLSPDLTFGNLAAHWNLPVVLVIKDRLGAINHTLLSLEAIISRDLKVAGLVLNERNDEVGNYETLRALMPKLTILSVPPKSSPTSAQVSWQQLFS